MKKGNSVLSGISGHSAESQDSSNLQQLATAISNASSFFVSNVGTTSHSGMNLMSSFFVGSGNAIHTNIMNLSKKRVKKLNLQKKSLPKKVYEHINYFERNNFINKVIYSFIYLSYIYFLNFVETLVI
jgi:hypothetical protein